MHSTARFHFLPLLVSITILAACTGMKGPDAATPGTPTTATAATAPSSTPNPAETPVVTGSESSTPVDTAVAPATPPANPAVVALLDKAHANESAGQLPTATAAIERALRIEPRNPVLWQELALLKLKKGDYQQAESCAARSNSWAGANKALLAKNWHIISEARSLRGDNQGAKAALDRAKALE